MAGGLLFFGLGLLDEDRRRGPGSCCSFVLVPLRGSGRGVSILPLIRSTLEKILLAACYVMLKGM
jgi:hypothetical protein